MSDPYGQPPSWGQPEQPGDWGYPQQPPGPPAPASGYPGSSYPTSGHPAPDPWGPPQSPGYPSQQPGYPPESYPGQQPGYPPQQPGYPAPSSGGPYQAYPQAYPPPPPPRRSRGPVIAGVIILVVVLCLGIGGAIALVANKDAAKTQTSGTTGPTTTTSTGSAPASVAPPTDTIKLVAPDRIGALRKMADQSQANSMLNQMSGAGIEHPFSVGYEDSANKARLAIAWGGTGQIFTIGGPERQLDEFFSSAGKSLSGGTVGTRQNVDPGSAGGSAQCAPVTGLGVSMALCAWAGGDGLLGVIISGLAPAQAGARMHEMLQAIVTKG